MNILTAFMNTTGRCACMLSCVAMQTNGYADTDLEQEAATIDFSEASLDFGEESPVLREEIQTIDIDFKEASIEHIVYEVAERCDLNVVWPDLFEEEKVTLKLKNVTWRQIFDVLLIPYSYSYFEDRNVITLRSYEQLRQEPLFWKTYSIEHRQASEVCPLIKKVLEKSKHGDCVADDGQNMLIVWGTKQDHDFLEHLLKRLDKLAVQYPEQINPEQTGE